MKQIKEVGDEMAKTIGGGCELINDFLSGDLDEGNGDDITVPVIFGVIILPIIWALCRYAPW